MLLCERPLLLLLAPLLLLALLLLRLALALQTLLFCPLSSLFLLPLLLLLTPPLGPLPLEFGALLALRSGLALGGRGVSRFARRINVQRVSEPHRPV